MVLALLMHKFYDEVHSGQDHLLQYHQTLLEYPFQDSHRTRPAQDRSGYIALQKSAFTAPQEVHLLSARAKTQNKADHPTMILVGNPCTPGSPPCRTGCSKWGLASTEAKARP